MSNEFKVLLYGTISICCAFGWHVMPTEWLQLFVAAVTFPFAIMMAIAMWRSFQ